MNRQSTLAARRRRMNSRGGSGPVAGEGSPPQPQAQGLGPGHGHGQGEQEELLPPLEGRYQDPSQLQALEQEGRQLRLELGGASLAGQKARVAAATTELAEKQASLAGLEELRADVEAELQPLREAVGQLEELVGLEAALREQTQSLEAEARQLDSTSAAGELAPTQGLLLAPAPLPDTSLLTCSHRHAAGHPSGRTSREDRRSPWKCGVVGGAGGAGGRAECMHRGGGWLEPTAGGRQGRCWCQAQGGGRGAG